ncbi:MAG TPA: alpha-2-macroglobulin family protein [Ignavibacteriales bacterium]|nr:alpha-2-macroglobulin family protein [Ignavibacteriales bacterium]
MPNKALKILICILILISTAHAQVNHKSQVHNKGAKKISTTEGYEKMWIKVDELEKAGLTQSAKKRAEEIYRKAEKEQNQQQMIKSLLVIYSLRSVTEENIEDAVIQELKGRISSAKAPYKNIYSSILAQAYEQYFNGNRYAIYQRTNVADSSFTEDFRTWDARRFQEEITRLYLNSLKDSNLLFSIPSAEFEELVRFNEGRFYITYTTLFDVLAGSALNYFTNTESSVTRPRDEFKINNADYLSPADEFVRLEPDGTDTLSLQYHACRIFRMLISNHLDKPDKVYNLKTLAQIDVMRLKFMYDNSVMDDKETLLLSTLRKSAVSYQAEAVSAIYWLKLAEYYITFSKMDKFKGQKNLRAEAMAICDSLVKKDTSLSEIEELMSLKKNLLERSLSYSSQSEVPAEKPFSAVFNYRNIDTLYISIIPMNQANQKLLDGGLSKPQSIYSKLNNAISLKRFFEKKADYKEHSAELILPPLKPGKYTLLASDNGNYEKDPGLIAYGEFQATKFSVVFKGHEGDTELLVTDRWTGAPEKDVDIEVCKVNYDYITSLPVNRRIAMLRTDENGFALLKNSALSYKLNITKNDDTLRTSSYIGTSYDHDNWTWERTYIFTDRAIYRPGQKLSFKGIVFEINNSEKKSRVIGGRDETVTLYDANRQVIKKLDVRTNEFGTFSGEFVIPSGLANGMWNISTSKASLVFRVEEYKRPQFEIKIDPQKNKIALNDSVTVTGSVVTYSGAPLTHAGISYSVTRSRSYGIWEYSGVSDPKGILITSGKISTDDQGHFTFVFPSLPDPFEKNMNIIFKFTLSVTAVDQTGETHTADEDLRAGYQDLFISGGVPEVVNSEEQKSIKISALNIENQPVAADINAVVYRLETPADVLIKRLWEKTDSRVTEQQWQVLSEGEQYEDELPYTQWKRAETVYEKMLHVNGDSVLYLDEIKNWKPGKYLLTLTARRKNGEATFERYFELYNPSANEPPVNRPLWAAVVTPEVRPGESASIVLGTGLKELPVLYEVENEKGILIRKWITLKKGQTELTFPAAEYEKDGFAVHLLADYKNMHYYFSENIIIKAPDLKLKIAFESFRDKMQPGAKEQWKLKIRMPDMKPAKAELLASMYDMSLDAFVKHDWAFAPYYANHQIGRRWIINDSYYRSLPESDYYEDLTEYNYISDYVLPALYMYGFSLRESYEPGSVLKSKKYVKKMLVKYKEDGTIRFLPPVVKPDDQVTDESVPTVEELHNVDPGASTQKGYESGVDYSLIEVQEAPKVQIVNESVADKIQGGVLFRAEPPQVPKQISMRKNLQETAFFFPHLVADENGETAITFTAPEALTRWRLMTFAHTKDMNYAYEEREVVTQKDMMIQANAPRFLREGDTIYFTARVSNLSGKQISGSANLNLSNAQNNSSVDSLLGNIQQQSFKVDKKEIKSLSWKLIIPYGGIQAVTWHLTASTDSSSDGEEGQLPVLTNSQLVTESMPVDVNSHETKDLIFNKLQENTSPTLRQHRLTFEFTSNPVWYAIQALPYLIEYPYECAEQTFSRYFANSMASYLINSDPRIRQVFDAWKQKGGNVLESNLMKNEELKNIILQETPWLRDAQDETAAKHRLALLFDMARLADGMSSTLKKLQDAQLPEGGWAWFKGMPPSDYITRYIVAGFGHLNKIKVIDTEKNKNVLNMIKSAIEFCDREMNKEYQLEMSRRHKFGEYIIGQGIIHYLYARSYFPSVPLKDEYRNAFDFWQKLAYEKWLSGSKYMQGMTAITAFRAGNKSLAKQIIASLKENATTSDEFGMYFKGNTGWYWFDAPIETQSLMIEAFDEISQDTASVDLMRKWLLKNKQTSSWETTRATSEACYALMLKGTNWISETKMPLVTIGNKEVEISADKAEAGTGYIKTSWDGSQITRDMAKLHVKNNNGTAAWGAMYWQYFENLDKITPGTTQLSLKKHVFLETEDKYGKRLIPVDETTPLKPGDMLKVRIELRSDRDMEYVHMKDMRASGFEPVNVLSTNKYQDGLFYYESTKDAATNFFIEYLAKGTYVFEYPLRVQYKGNFSNGITTVQCMYAPEFTSHSEGVRLRVE